MTKWLPNCKLTIGGGGVLREETQQCSEVLDTGHSTHLPEDKTASWLHALYRRAYLDYASHARGKAAARRSAALKLAVAEQCAQRLQGRHDER